MTDKENYKAFVEGALRHINGYRDGSLEGTREDGSTLQLTDKDVLTNLIGAFCASIRISYQNSEHRDFVYGVMRSEMGKMLPFTFEMPSSEELA